MLSRANGLPGRDWPGSCSEGREITGLGQRSGQGGHPKVRFTEGNAGDAWKKHPGGSQSQRRRHEGCVSARVLQLSIWKHSLLQEQKDLVGRATEAESTNQGSPCLIDPFMLPDRLGWMGALLSLPVIQVVVQVSIRYLARGPSRRKGSVAHTHRASTQEWHMPLSFTFHWTKQAMWSCLIPRRQEMQP